ncbi:uncharacterized protein PAC_14913 [Phialocephala subalpina]|uniref:Uncharacterized protein n=1 Tax=Phialocephala subalpina TaxID=576137 RepID=A0A1L7XJ16_9HELO|nr:uncharacterized protein PAC_14913 [Phialocephala subalpina]
MRLDEKFYYLQDDADNPAYRYLVYHPFAPRGRDLPQRSFAVNGYLETAKSLTAAAAKSDNEYIGPAGLASGVLVRLIASLTSDPLRQFPALDDAQKLHDVSKVTAQKEADWNKKDRDLYRQIEKAGKEMEVLVAGEQIQTALSKAASGKLVGNAGQQQSADESIVEACKVRYHHLPFTNALQKVSGGSGAAKHSLQDGSKATVQNLNGANNTQKEPSGGAVEKEAKSLAESSSS